MPRDVEILPGGSGSGLTDGDLFHVSRGDLVGAGPEFTDGIRRDDLDVLLAQDRLPAVDPVLQSRS